MVYSRKTWAWVVFIPLVLTAATLFAFSLVLPVYALTVLIHYTLLKFAPDLIGSKSETIFAFKTALAYLIIFSALFTLWQLYIRHFGVSMYKGSILDAFLGLFWMLGG